MANNIKVDLTLLKVLELLELEEASKLPLVKPRNVFTTKCPLYKYL